MGELGVGFAAFAHKLEVFAYKFGVHETLKGDFFFLHLASVSCNPEPIRFVESHYASYNYSQALWLLLLEAMFVALDKT